MNTAKDLKLVRGEAKAFMRDAAQLPLVLTVYQVQEILGISRAKAYELSRRNGFPAVRIGRVIRIPRDAFFIWLEAQTLQGGQGNEGRPGSG